MIILPSLGRPNNFIRLVEACRNTDTTIPVWVRLNSDDVRLPEYLEIETPENWDIVIGPRSPLSIIYNEAYSKLFHVEQFIFIADDVVPLTNQWDVKLIEVAGLDGMAVPAGGHDPNGTPHFALGGNLVRSMGWLALPGLDRLYIDTVWADIAKSRGVLRRVPDVTLEHMHFSNHKALIDATYLKKNKVQDKLIYDKWRQENDYLP